MHATVLLFEVVAVNFEARSLLFLSPIVRHLVRPAYCPGTPFGLDPSPSVRS